MDPYWLTARFPSLCSCAKPIAKGERIFYYPKGKTALCPQCSETASSEFQNAVQDENLYNSQY